MHTHAIILAAGKGKRMHSSKPKVLQVLSAQTLLSHTFTTAKKVAEVVHIVYGFGGDEVRGSINDDSINWVRQKSLLGTGDAVSKAMPSIDDDAMVVVLYGDVPLIKAATLRSLIAKAKKTDFAILSAVMQDPSGYGRIIRDKNQQVQAIIEQKDATSAEQKIDEVNTGIIAIKADLLRKCLAKLTTNNSQAELYLTDVVGLAVAQGVKVATMTAATEFEVFGVNDKQQLAELERFYQENQAQDFMAKGLGLKDFKRFDCRGKLKFGTNCEIDINVLFEGVVELGDNCIISPNCVLKNAKIGKNVRILPNCVLCDCEIKDDAIIGPFAHIRPQTTVGKNAKIGNFVELKKSTIATNSKVPHLSYIGDSTVGKNVNIGAGVITCNYDGVKKHQTKIGDGAFIGSNSQLIAPITIGKNAKIGAGSTITKNAPANQTTLSRPKQKTIKPRT